MPEHLPEFLRKFRDPARIYLLLAPLFYLAYAIYTPPFQTPDEHQHLFRAWQLSEFQLLGERRGNESGGYLPPSLSRAAAKEIGTVAPHKPIRIIPKTSLAARFSALTPLNHQEPRQFSNFLGSVGYSPAGCVPQIIAIWLGKAMDLSVETILRLGRILNSILAIALFALAFRCLPFGRPALLLVGLLPMTAACAGSFGQDGLIIGGCCLLTALGLQALVQGKWHRSTIPAYCALTSAIVLAKLVYLPLAALALFPRSSRAPIAEWVKPQLAATVLGGTLLALWLWLNAGLVVPMMDGLPAPAEQLRMIIDHPSIFPHAFANFYQKNWFELMKLTFQFGWQNVGPVMFSLLTMMAATVLVLWNGDRAAIMPHWTWRLWTIAVLAAIISLLSLALYLTATPLAADSISGIQGRYFVPLALPFLLAIMPARKVPGELPAVLVLVLICLSNVVSLQTIGHAYYL